MALNISIYRPLQERTNHYFLTSLAFSPNRARRRVHLEAPGTQAANASNSFVDDNVSSPKSLPANLLIQYRNAGITGTVSWSTLNAIDGKMELDGTLAKDLKVEATGTFKPDTNDTASKINLFFKQPAFHLRGFIDALKGPTVTADAVVGHDGFVAGGEASC